MNNSISRVLSVAGFLSMVTVVEPQAVGSSLDVTFTGSLVDRMCEFEQGDAALEVTFPARSLKYFEQYTRTETEPFVIGLKNCTLSTKDKVVDLTFSFPQTEMVNGTVMLKPSGDTGLVIGLLDGKGHVVMPDHAVDIGTITQAGGGTLNRFTLGAYVMAPPGVTVKAGQYSATTTFTVSYR
ncbi:TPA: type 1 fimbrial protein [Salmonella enterica subsp. salamae serovar 9,46:z4,z24:z39:z42]|nr:type 1 fimbrial protein [Salmonella enterica subsp. salamae serovar 9,46:z4,z24:z39:z42]